jgi:hypothetical protein
VGSWEACGEEQSKSVGASYAPSTRGATRLADLDLLLTAGFATADDLRHERTRNARRSVTDAEVVTLAVAQAVMDIPSDRECLALAGSRPRLGQLIPKPPKPPGSWQRRARLAETIGGLGALFAQDAPGSFDDVVLVDSTPVQCGRSVDTARRSQRAPACAHHHRRSPSRWFSGMRRHRHAPVQRRPGRVHPARRPRCFEPDENDG